MELLKSLIARIDRLKTRERIMVLAAFLALIGFATETLYLAPARAELARERARIQTQQARLADLSAKETQLAVRLQVDLDAETKKQIQALRRDIALEEEQLEAEMNNLVSPAEMIRLLRDMLPNDDRLELTGLRSLPTTAIHARTEDVGTPTLYRRGVELELNGEYLALLDYLRAVESSDWRLHWDLLKIEILEYPRVVIHLRVHTLTLDSGWIGV